MSREEPQAGQINPCSLFLGVQEFTPRPPPWCTHLTDPETEALGSLEPDYLAPRALGARLCCSPSGEQTCPLLQSNSPEELTGPGLTLLGFISQPPSLSQAPLPTSKSRELPLGILPVKWMNSAHLLVLDQQSSSREHALTFR